MFYVLAGVQLKTQCAIPSFAEFEGEESSLPTIEFTVSQEPFIPQTILQTIYHKDINITVLENGWLYTLAVDENYKLEVPALKDKVVLGDIGTVIGSHTGPGTLVVCFWGNERA